jgi:molybdopterin-guanine dinucleotide biosynthesis protein B
MYTVCIIGSKNVGKTYLAEQLIKRFTSDGIRVAAVKSSRHPLDMPNTDTERLAKAGAQLVLFGSSRESAVFIKSRVDTRKLLSKVGMDFEVLLVEGMKRSEYPKVLLAKGPEDLKIDVDSRTVEMVICSKELRSDAKRKFPSAVLRERNEIGRIYSALKKKYIQQYVRELPDKDCGACGYKTCAAYGRAILKGETKPGKCSVDRWRVKMYVDDSLVKLSPYPESVAQQVIGAFLSTLHGVRQGYRKVEIYLDRRRR